MALLGRLRRRPGRPGTLRDATGEDLEHLAAFLRAHGSAEAYLEPRTAVTETTVVLVAPSGEWTRRRVRGESGARQFAKSHGIPLYEAAVVGYPQRMREWTARHRSS